MKTKFPINFVETRERIVFLSRRVVKYPPAPTHENFICKTFPWKTEENSLAHLHRSLIN